jgi:alpha-tubulin suppressor-like RCC1 family protein
MDCCRFGIKKRMRTDKTAVRRPFTCCALILTAFFSQFAHAATDGTLLILRNATNSSPRIISIWGGAASQIILKSDGTVWDWGNNQYGALGNGMTNNSDIPVQVLGSGGLGYLNSVSAVMGNERHNIALKSDGTVWAWGWNYFGQLGDGSTNWGYFTSQSVTPAKVFGLTSVKWLGGRGYHSVVVKTDGTIWSWGNNWYGQLGNGTTNLLGTNTPVQVKNLTNPAAISGGGFFSLALMPDGSIWSWGNNTYGQLGDGTFINRSNPVRVVGLSNMIGISCGFLHALALKSDGTAWAWGQNGNGCLGNGTSGGSSNLPVQVLNLSNVVAVSGGDAHSMARCADGTIWKWGANNMGDMGVGTSDTNAHPYAVQVPGLSNVLISTARDLHNLVVKTDGSVWTWGDDRFGCGGDLIGSNITSPRVMPGLVSNNLIGYGESFESYPNGSSIVGTNSWFSDNPAAATVIVTNYTLPYTGPFPISGPHQQALLINGAVTNRFCPSFYSNAWVDLIVQACPSSNPVLPSLTNAAFALCVTTNGHLAVWNCTNASSAGNGWTELLDTDLASNQFCRVTINANYIPDANGFCHYSVWVNGLPSTNPSATYTAADSSQPWFGEIDAMGHFCLDDLVVATNKSYCALVASSSVGGFISPAGTVIAPLGSTNAFTLTPINWFDLAAVTVDGAGAGTPASYTFTNIAADHTIAANFAAELAAMNTPKWWLYQTDPAWSANFDAAALSNLANKGMSVWEEYIAGTDPLIASSLFAANIAVTNGQQIVSFPTVPTTPLDAAQRYYAIDGATDLQAAHPWTPITGWTNILGAGQPVTYTNSAVNQSLFFRARVWLGP